MRKFTKQAAQGDVVFTRIGEIPKECVLVPPVGIHVVVAHSESSHHHVMDAEKVEMYRLPEELYECFLVVKEATTLNHLRSFDTHESILFDPGIYRVNRQREYTPQGMRRVED